MTQTLSQVTIKQLPIKTIPYEHQDRAFQIGIALDQSALLMEQGTGKTLSAIAVAGYRYQYGQIKRLLVISPLSVVPVWSSEFSKHAGFEYSLVTLDDMKEHQRAEILAAMPTKGLQVVVINYDATWRCIDLLIKWKPDMVIVDESQKIKNGRAKRSKAIHKLGDMVNYRMILTGTPITQGPLDVWSQYRFLNHALFGRRYLSFRERYAIMGGYGGYEVKGYRNLPKLAQKAHSVAFRVTKKEALDLPETTDQKVIVNLSPETMRIYQQMENKFLVKFADTVATAPIILTQLLRLQQITGGFLPTEDGAIKEFDSAKLEAVRELLEDFPSEKKVVIFARFISEIMALEKISQSQGRNPITLYGAIKDRGEAVRRFQEDSGVKDIIIQIQTGGLGITLTAADTAIFYSTTFSYADYDQAKARLHRIGQRNPVTYIHILANNTVDEQVLEVLDTKEDMAAQIVDRMREKWSKNHPSGPFTNPLKRDSMNTNINRREKGTEPMGMRIGLGNSSKTAWQWDKDTNKIIRRREDGKLETLGTAISPEEALKMVQEHEGNKEGKGEKKVASKKETKKTGKTDKEMTDAVDELKEIVEDEGKEKKGDKKETKPETTKKMTKAEKRADKKATAQKETESEKKTTKKDKKDQDTSNEVGAKELAAQLKIDPKLLRKELRAMFPDHESKDRWVWTKNSKELANIIKKLSAKK